MTQSPLTVRRWKRAEYDRLVELGAFDGDPVELIAGQLAVAEPQRPYHASAVGSTDYALRAVLPPGWIVRTQSPVWLDDESEPEPDLVVVPGLPADYRLAHPGRPVLTIEVAESSLAFDHILFARWLFICHMSIRNQLREDRAKQRVVLMLAHRPVELPTHPVDQARPILFFVLAR